MISLTWKFCKCCPGKIHVVWCSKTFTLNKAGLFNLHRGTWTLKNSSFSIKFHNAIHSFIPKSTNLLHVNTCNAYWKYQAHYKPTLFQMIFQHLPWKTGLWWQILKNGLPQEINPNPKFSITLKSLLKCK